MTSKVDPHFIVECLGCSSQFDTYDEAVESASRRASDNRDEFGIYQLVASAKSPTPAAVVTKVTV